MITKIISRKIRRLLTPALVLAMMAAGYSGFAQEPDSLPGYLAAAALKNPGLKAKYSEYLAALEKVPQAGALPDPEMQFGFYIQKMELMEGYQLADIRLMQMTPWFGTLKAAKDEASKMALAKLYEVESMKNDLLLQVKLSWYELFKIKKEIESAEKSLVILQSLERLALIRFRSAGTAGSGATGSMPPGEESTRNSGSMSMTGETAGNPVKTSETASNQMTGAPDPRMGGSGQGGMIELLRVQMETGELNIRLALLKELLITERTKFNSILNREPGSGVFINDSLPLANLPGSISNLADSIDHNPMVRMYVADREANEARIKMAEKMGYPMIGLGLSYTVIQKFPEINSMMNGKDMVMPMVTATLPVYRKKYRAQKLEAGYLRDAADESAGYAKNNLQVNFREAVQLYEDAGRRAELYTRQATLAGRTITLLTRSFSVAGTDFEEILRMQQQLLDYEFKRIEALVDSNRAAATIQSIVSHR